MMPLAFAAALLGMLLYGVASVSQAWAARRASGPAVLRHPGYLAGLACDGLAWLASLVALVRLPVFVVQSLLAGSLAVTVLLAAKVLRVRPTRRDILGIAVVVTGLVLVSLSAGPESQATPRPPLLWVLAGAVLLIAVAGAALYPRGGMLAQGTAAGLGFGAAAVCGRAASLTCHSMTDVLRSPVAWSVLVAGLVGATLYARALEHGPVGPPTATMWVMEVLAPGAAGMALLGDSVRGGWGVAALLGVLLAVIGCAVLATSAAQDPEDPAPPPYET